MRVNQRESAARLTVVLQLTDILSALSGKEEDADSVSRGEQLATAKCRVKRGQQDESRGGVGGALYLCCLLRERAF